MAIEVHTGCTVADIAARSRNALVGGPFGSDLVSKDYVPSGVPVIRGINMGQGRWVGGEFAYVTAEKADSLSSNCAKPGDLIFTQRGTLGQVALIPQVGPDRYLISQSQMKLSVDPKKADSLFLYYVFTGAEQQAYIRQNAIQTGVPHTNLGILRKTPLSLPQLARQKAIAEVLGSLDDKIELNRRMNATLEAMARALFPQWFYYHWTRHYLGSFRLIAASKATTMGHIQRKHLSEAKVLVPPSPVIEALTPRIQPLLDQIVANGVHARTLATLRDTLLPKLLSGDLSVASVDKEVEHI